MGYMTAGEIYSMINKSVDIGRENRQADQQAYAAGIANKIKEIQSRPDYDYNKYYEAIRQLEGSLFGDQYIKDIAFLDTQNSDYSGSVSKKYNYDDIYSDPNRLLGDLQDIFPKTPLESDIVSDFPTDEYLTEDQLYAYLIENLGLSEYQASNVLNKRNNPHAMNMSGIK